MSKYIRTKDGIFKWNDSIFIDNDMPQGESYKSCNGVYYLSKADIVNQADTIEELCDEFVCFTLDKERHAITSSYQTAKEFYQRNWIIYGAIWTDKGLIYVAKMNDKGELELL